MKISKCIYVIFLIIVQLAFYSCDNREDYFIEVNKAPTLTLIKNGVDLTGNMLTDSLKIGYSLSLNYIINDEERIKILVLQPQQGVSVDVGSESISFNGLTEGQNNISLVAKDSFGEEAEFSVSFNVFRNVAPIASFLVSKIGISSPFEYEVDASASCDKDTRFNGHVVEYEYTLQNYTFTTTLSKIRYVFGSSGQKLIRVRVKDNSGDWSESVSEYVVLK
jgi:hypothetical protein